MNEEAVKFYHFENALDAIGKSLIIQDDSSQRQVIGVVKDYQHELFGERLEPMALIYDPEKYSILQVEYNGDFADASRTIEQTWARINPGVKLDMRLFEDELGRMYEIVFGTLVKVLGFISFLAITISCLGLLGMATYTIETRKKEIAVRKILGSSNKALVYILSKGYVSILLLSLVIALPVAYYMNMFWLENLANHVSIDIVTVASGVLVLAFFGLFTIASQTIQATFLNPVENLKND